MEHKLFHAKDAPEPLIFLSIFMLCHQGAPEMQFTLEYNHFSKIVHNNLTALLFQNLCKSFSSTSKNFRSRFKVCNALKNDSV